MTRLRLGTRGSQLALYQARAVAALMAERGGTQCEIVVIRTSGDQIADPPLSEAGGVPSTAPGSPTRHPRWGGPAALGAPGGKRVFVKELEDALLDGSADLAVHSSKDLPAELPGGLEIGGVLPREDPSDVLVQRGAGVSDFHDLARELGSAHIGTGSVRRIAQLRRVLPEARFEPIRGNLDTRLRKLEDGDYDAIVLAAAGMRRLNLAERISAVIPTDICVPAPGQGVIAIEIRADDARARAAVAAIDDADTAVALRAERSLVLALGGGCQMPVGGLCQLTHGVLDLMGIVASLDGTQFVRHRKLGPRHAAADLGRDLAEQLLRDGAAEILAEARAGGIPIADPHGP